jgi:mono/diheme cytochrome c family protein
MPMMPPMPEGLEPPPTVYPPTQASQGAHVYYLVCMACHGDKGQGLTDEWRNVLDEKDRNCWQSKCHASNHPLEGFELPRTVPAIIGPGEMEIFRTALDLHDYIQARMPWQAPGSLSEDEYWQLTAFLVQANGFDPGDQPIDAERAAELYLGVQPTPTPHIPWSEYAGGRFWLIAAVALLLPIAVGVFLAWSRKKSPRCLV